MNPTDNLAVKNNQSDPVLQTTRPESDYSSTGEAQLRGEFSTINGTKPGSFFRDLRRALHDLVECATEAHRLVIELVAIAAIIWLVIHGK